jgi:Xaa-Pro aminopeptidase
MPVAHGLGLGFDPPVVTPDLRITAAEEILEPGMVLSVTGYVWQEGVGAVFGREAVLVTADGPDVLTSSPSWSHRAGVGIG